MKSGQGAANNVTTSEIKIMYNNYSLIMQSCFETCDGHVSVRFIVTFYSHDLYVAVSLI